MHLFQILLPRADNAGQPFAREDFDRVKEELAADFEGVTAYLQAPAEGLWREGADSDEAAPLFRHDCAPGFRDDLAPWG
jgi:hypothetical protein